MVKYNVMSKLQDAPTNVFSWPLTLTFAMENAAPIKEELDLRYGDIGNIQGRVYFPQNTKTSQT